MRFKGIIEREMNKGGAKVMSVIDVDKDVKKETLIQGAVTASWGSEEPLTEELEGIVVKKYKDNVAVTKIMEEHGMSSGKVYRILRRNGVEKRRGPYKRESAQRMLTLTDRQKKDIADAYIRDVPVLEIAKNFDINYQTVYDILDERSIVRRSEKGIAPNAKSKRTTGVVDEEDRVGPIVAKVDNKTAREVIDKLNAMKESGELYAGIIMEEPKVEKNFVVVNGKTVVVHLDVKQDDVDELLVKYK